MTWGLQVFQDNQVWEVVVDNQDQEVFKGPLALKENQVLGVYLVPLVLQDYLDQEERWDNLETKATRDHKVSQAL